MAHVFISYKRDRANNIFVGRMSEYLKEAGFELWIDTAELQAGEDWRDAIDQAIRDSLALIVVLTPEAVESQYVTYEWAFAFGVGKDVIPILYKDAPLHPRLAGRHYFDFTERSRSRYPWKRLIARLVQIRDATPEISASQDKSQMSPAVRKAVEGLDSPLPEQRKAAIDSLVQMFPDPEAEDELIGALRHPIRDVREAAANQIGHKPIAHAVPALINVLHEDTATSVRETAIGALGQTKDKRAVKDLCEILDNKEEPEQIRSKAASALGDIIDVTSAPALIKALSDETSVRREAIAALGSIGDKNTAPLLEEFLADKNDVVRRNTVGSLGQIGDPRSVPALERALGDSDFFVQWGAAYALKKIGTESALKAAEKFFSEHNISNPA